MEDQELAKLKRAKLRPHPRTQTNFFSHLFFYWELPLILQGRKKDISEDDLCTPLEDYESGRLGDQLEKLWHHEETLKKPSLARALLKQFGREFAIYGLLYLPVELVFAVMQPHFLQKFLDYYTPNQKTITRGQALLYAEILAILLLFRLFSHHIFSINCLVVGMKVRVACSSLIYRRCLRFTHNSMDRISTGRVLNLMSNDMTRFEQVFFLLHYIWIGPLQLALLVFYMDLTLGYTSLAGVSVIVACLLFQLVLSRKVTSLRRKVADKTDHRIRLLNDVISGIQAIKMYTWEKPYSKLITAARRLEAKEIATATNIRLFNGAFKVYLSKACIFLCILAAILTDHPVTPQYFFALNSIYETLKVTVTIFLPMGVIMFSESITSVQRIQELLLDAPQKEVLKLGRAKPGVHLDNVSVKWDPIYVLQDVTFNATPGALVGVVGSTGSGKSTLLQVILQEVPTIAGEVAVGGIVSYASQDSWIFPSSIKQNIIFGQRFDSAKYLKVIEVCALERDLVLFPHGDQTLVGERGAMLSGGQKARINLARAVYKDADIYLLDDPLSAVDAHVGRHIFDQCILTYLKEKCVILVTHQTHYLKKAATIYHLDAGKVVNFGKYDQMVHSSASASEAPLERSQVMSLDQYSFQNEIREHRTGTRSSVYRSYCASAGSWVFSSFVFLLFGISQLFVSAEDLLVTFWVGKPEFLTTANFLYVYLVITVVAVVITHLAATVFARFCVRASKSLHENMIGRILDRFSKDMGSIDEILPTHFNNAITIVCTAVVILITVMAVNYWMAIPTIILLGATIAFYVVFRPWNRSIKRIEATTRSAVFSHISASLQGLVTIRATNVQKQLIKEFDSHQDLHSSAFYLFLATFEAFGFWADSFALFYSVLLIFSFFVLESEAPAANIGLAITQSFGLVMMTQYAMKTFGELDSQMSSVERVVEYAELEPEADEGKNVPSEAWPQAGDIVFKSVSLKYGRNDPPVLKLSVTVNSGEKIGIVGRTGAGKTSIISVLFRLFHFDGSVVIDDVDTKTVPLNVLRSKISIIPQEPVLFLGTLRKNIDPFDEFSDYQIWEALDEFELKEMVSRLPSGLDSPVSERGSNFSVGQRQLLCLIRAMLKNNKIIVLDEATANLDLKTDRLIQSAVRKKFQECTVLTVAHRLNTVMDSDKILVMDSGVVVEFGPPEELLRNAGGSFYGYVMESGDDYVK